MLIGLLTASTFAGAEEGGAVCLDPRIRLEGQPDDRWLGPIRQACDALRAMPDGDPTSSARLVPVGDDLIVEVVLADGRSTLRRIHEPAVLVTTLEAVLTLPPPMRGANESAPARVGPSPTPETTANERPAPAAPKPLTVEIGGALGGRIAGQAYYSASVSGHAHFLVDAWLFGVSARWDVFEVKSGAQPRDFEMDTVGVGVSVARRLSTSFATFDIGISPRLLVETQSTHPTFGREDTDAQTDVRLGAFTHAGFGHRALRPFVELDAEISPARIRRDIRIEPGLPVLPAWSAGLGVGVLWGGR